MNSVDIDFPTSWKGYLYSIFIILSITFFLVAILWYLTTNINEVNEMKDSACRDLGYESFTTKWFTDYCINNTEVIEVVTDCNNGKCIAGKVK
jgi:hypothetical protein